MGEVGKNGVPQGQTVGDYLSSPTGASWVRRAGDALAALALTSWALALVIHVFQGRVFADFGVLSAETIDLLPLVMPLAVIGAVCAVLAALFYLVAKLGGFSKHDDLGAVKRAALRVMLDNPRFGITEQTPLSRVPLRCEHLFKGSGVGAVKCWNCAVPFMPQDFAASNPADFGGVDTMCADGRLYVFMSVDAKRRFIEAQQRKGRGAAW